MQYKHFDKETKMFNEQSAQQDQANENGISREIEGLRQLSRRSSEELYQANVSLGQVRQDLEATKADVKKLILQMEQVYTHIRGNLSK